MSQDNLVIQINKESVDAADIGACREAVDDVLLESYESARNYFQSVLFWFPSYDDEKREVYEMQEVRKWFVKVDEGFPFSLYFLMPGQYYLYVSSQKWADGIGLTFEAVIEYISEHDKAIELFCSRIEDDFGKVSTSIGMAVREMLQ